MPCAATFPSRRHFFHPFKIIEAKVRRVQGTIDGVSHRRQELIIIAGVAVSHLHSSGASTSPLWCDSPRRLPPIGFCLVGIQGAGSFCPHASWLRQVEAHLKNMAWRLPGRWPDGGLPEGYGHDGPVVCLGDGQTEDEGEPSQGGRGDALLRCLSPNLT